eukprot:TRINITY_DN9059_c0_g2_i3.p1 TRINITY_DN9059_c0_g2~~TRINITY_DN9059_c0_g2_i3.p1  ORF type:complete len:118 (+),score=7.27 TRINITY_DN9059_c0_g2_i3:60-413(+)
MEKDIVSSLPDDILVNLIEFLSLDDLHVLGSLSKRFFHLVDSDEVWRYKTLVRVRVQTIRNVLERCVCNGSVSSPSRDSFKRTQIPRMHVHISVSYVWKIVPELWKILTNSIHEARI